MTQPTDRPTDHAGLQVLSFAECLELAASQPVGRVAFSRDGDIEVLPVNHCLLGNIVAFRTARGPKLTAAFLGSVVAFEVDSYDASRHTGWSVLVKGRADLATDEALLRRLRDTGLQTWSASAARSDWVVIRADAVSGRRLDPGSEPPRRPAAP